jgi:hypothetical protein
MFATFAWTGCFLAVASLRVMQTLVKNYVGWFASWIFAAVALSLGGLGIYLGRFSRWNSWDLFLQPKADPLRYRPPPGRSAEQPAFFRLSPLPIHGISYWSVYLMFISVRRVGDTEKRVDPGIMKHPIPILRSVSMTDNRSSALQYAKENRQRFFHELKPIRLHSLDINQIRIAWR